MNLDRQPLGAADPEAAATGRAAAGQEPHTHADHSKLTDREAQAIANIAEQTGIPETLPMAWYFISFADSTLPEGAQFLGGCYVEAPSHATAVMVAGAFGCNPGGEAKIAGPLPDEVLEEHVLPEDRYRLLTKADLGETEVWDG